jgi:hypothetical protein
MNSPIPKDEHLLMVMKRYTKFQVFQINNTGEDFTEELLPHS